MKLDDILRHYITSIRKFDFVLSGNYTAEDIYNLYK